MAEFWWLKCAIVLSILSCYVQHNSEAKAFHNLTIARRVSVSDTLISDGGFYKLGFFSPTRDSKNLHLGIWFTKAKTKEVVWVANREQHFTTTSPVLIMGDDGNLATLDGNASYLVTNATVNDKNTIAFLLDSGNLVLKDKYSKVILWQSFDYPTDTILPGMKMGYDNSIGKLWAANSWKSLTDPSPGPFRVLLHPSGSGWSVIERNFQGRTYAYGTSWLGDKINSTWSMKVHDNQVLYNYSMPKKDYASVVFETNGTNFFIKYKVVNTGQIKVLIWTESYSDWVQLFALPNTECDFYGYCGKYSICDQDNPATPCSCLPGFDQVSSENWENESYSDGCQSRTNIVCSNSTSNSETKYTFTEVTGVTLPIFTNSLFGLDSEKECRSICKSNCSCYGYSFRNSRCLIFDGELTNIQRLPSGNQSNVESIFIKVAVSNLNIPKGNSQPFVLNGWKLWLTVVTTLSVAIVSSSVFIYQLYKDKIFREEGKDLVSYNFHESTQEEPPAIDEQGNGITRYQIPLFHFASVCSATDDFSAINKLGKGGFGAVYKGTLQNGEEIAVKRLSKIAAKGSKEIRNEALLIAELQHDNLVRLLGCCLEGNENIVIYEYFPNRSLDNFLFDPTAAMQLDWENRARIIDGIAEGLNYLHEYSRIQIIHGDLKATNILLDENMNPKISDFAMTRVFGANETLATNRMSGTFGYMSPEYASKGIVSNKSDVFSFGVLVLEILSGKMNNYRSASSLNLVGCAWDLWKCDRPLDIIDPIIAECGDPSMKKFIDIALLCVQENDNDRPSMSDVVSYLRNEVMDIPIPKEPAFTRSRALV
ncbi:G-type lectin S-receptor-like serine/threonine-protein kinase B120 [Euphorbia peplus]|nr:G-type lectin S-receptor-like serine/threonine-protein kinase B120 [Euphorbia peplus]